MWSQKQGTDWKQFNKLRNSQPDLILLDIQPAQALDGFRLWVRIREVVPSAKILFLTHNSDKDIVRMVLSAGAQGYLLKTDAQRELLIAVETVLGGGVFVGGGIKSRDSGETEDG